MRRYDIDFLRVILFALLIFVHVGNFFDHTEGIIKNETTYEWMKYPQHFFSQWRLSLLFVISGIGTFYNISKKNGWEFVKDRFRRLFIPLVVGILFIVPPQVYLERLDKGQFNGNFFEFWPLKAFVGVYPEGNFSWHHLWFVAYLFIFTIILIPVFLYLKNHPNAWIIHKVKKLTDYKFGLFALVIPLIVWQLLLSPRFPTTHNLVYDWFNSTNYCTLFFYGFLLISFKDILWKNLMNNRRLYLFVALSTFALNIFIVYFVDSFSYKWVVTSTGRAIYEWTMIVALIGYAATYFNKSNAMLTYANEAVFPIFILHLTITVLLSYYLKNIQIYMVVKFLIMIIGTFGISWLIYEFGIRRYNWVRPLFGMKRKA